MATPPVKPPVAPPPANPSAAPPAPPPKEKPPVTIEDAKNAVAASALAHDEDAKAYAEVYEKEQPVRPAYVRAEMPGMPPPDDMYRSEEPPPIVSENTRAEMDAGAAALKAYAGRGADEQAAGRKALADKVTHRE